MKRRCILMLLVVVSLAGCGTNQRRAQAYNRWYHARAKMLNGVAAERLKYGQLDKARNKAQEALALDPKYCPALIVLSKIHIEQGNYRQAVVTLERLHTDNPKNAEIVFLLAVAQEKNHQLDQALVNYQLAYALDDSNISCVIAASEVLASLGRITEAQSYIKGYLGQTTSEPAIFELAGRLAMMLRQYSQAANYFRQASEINIKNSFYRESLARAEFLSGQYSKALEVLKELVTKKEYVQKAWVHTMIGDCYMALSRPGNARDSYYAARQIKGDDPGIWTDIAKAALALKDTPRAILASREALRLDETCLEASMILGYALIRDGQNAQAIRVLKTASSQHPRNADVRCLLGRAYAGAGDGLSAKRCYRLAVHLEPENKLAKTLLKQGENF